MQIKSQDYAIQQHLATLNESQQKAASAADVARAVERELAAKGIKAVAKVESSGDVTVKRLLVG